MAFSTVLRYFEIFLLVFAITMYPILGLIFSLSLWYVSPYASNFAKIFLFLLMILSFVFTVLWNTRYGMGGIGFIPPLKNYLHHTESETDIALARLSIVLFLGFFILILILFFMLIKLQYI